MVVVVSNASVTNDAFIAAVLGAALSAATAREVGAASLGRDHGVGRYFVGSTSTTHRVSELVSQGRSYADVLGAIQGGGAS
jgi:hypothetical protein